MAQRLGGHTAGAPTCSEILFDVLTPDYGASRSSEYATALRWIDPDGEPSADQPDRCAVPTPDEPGSTHVRRDADGPMVAENYVVFRVRSPVKPVDVGCERALSWFGPCRGERQGFPVLGTE